VTAILDTVQSWVGLSGRHPQAQVRYRTATLLLPDDESGAAMRYLHGPPVPSTCALTVMAYLRARGVSHEALATPYLHQIGRAMADVETVGRALGCWTQEPAELATMPAPEDVVRIGNDADLGWAHVFVVTAIDADTGVVESVDGGQGDGGAWILPRKRILLATALGAYFVDPDRPYLEGGRPNGRRATGKLRLG